MKRQQLILGSVCAAVLLCLAAAAPFISVNLYQGSLALRGASTNLFSSNAPLLNASVDLSSRQPSNGALTVLSTNNGGALTNLNASELRTGTVPNGRLGSEVATTTNANQFASPQTFLGTATFGGLTLSNWFGFGLSLMEWESDRATFSASSSSVALQAGGLNSTAINGGSLQLLAAVVPGHQGLEYIQSAANNGAAGSGLFVHRFFNTAALLTTDNIWICIWQPYNTNGVMHRLGWGNSVANTDPVDASHIVGTNGTAVFQNIFNSTKVNSNSFTLPLQVWCATIMYHTNNSSFAAFWNYTNGVLHYAEVIGGFPTNRVTAFAIGALGFTSASTNSPTALLVIDDEFNAISRKGY